MTPPSARREPVPPRLSTVLASPGALGPVLTWSLPMPCTVIGTAVLGGGLGLANWLVNVTVDPDYGRLDPADHLAEVAAQLGLTGDGVGLMTAVDVASVCTSVVGGVRVDATVGVRRPVFAAEAAAADASAGEVLGPGTINVVAQLPSRLSASALVNAVATVTEAKVQAMYDTGVPGTGTASDAVCVLCPTDGASDPFGGPRSRWGAPLAQAVYEAVVAGVARQRSS